MLTHAIGFVQDVQLACFAVVLTCMSLQDRANRSLRWLAWGYVAGLWGAVLDAAGHWLPHWVSRGVVMEAPLIGYGCIYVSVALFVRRGVRARWICAGLAALALPFFLHWQAVGAIGRSATLQDSILGLNTAMTALLLLIAVDRETRWPRRMIAAFLSLYSAVEFLRVGIFIGTGEMPAHIAPGVEIMSGFVYVVSCSVLPLAFIWMMNARLLIHLGRLTMLDPLTELLNRRGLQIAAEQELARYARTGEELAVVVMDIDHFKALNDQYGHDGGDLVLSGVSGLLRRLVRETDIVGRLGGEEFTVILPGVTREEAIAAVERLRVALMEHNFQMQGRQAHITASFGITISSARRNLTWELLQHEADLALYMAKHAGRNVAKFFGDIPADSDPDIAVSSG